MFKTTKKWFLPFSLACLFGVEGNDILAKGEHGHHGGHHGHDHHWHHAHHDNWWHHAHHPGWEHHYHEYWNTWHHPAHDWYWYGAGTALGVTGLEWANAKLDHPGYYYDPNYYYLQEGVPSVEYQYDEATNQAPSEESLKAIPLEQIETIKK